MADDIVLTAGVALEVLDRPCVHQTAVAMAKKDCRRMRDCDICLRHVVDYACRECMIEGAKIGRELLDHMIADFEKRLRRVEDETETSPAPQVAHLRSLWSESTKRPIPQSTGSCESKSDRAQRRLKFRVVKPDDNNQPEGER